MTNEEIELLQLLFRWMEEEPDKPIWDREPPEYFLHRQGWSTGKFERIYHALKRQLCS